MGNNKKKTFILLAAATVLIIALGIGIFLYVSNNTAGRKDNLPPIIKQVIKLNQNIKQTTIDLYNASGKLDSVSMVQSRITDIKSTIELIRQLRELIKKNQEEVDHLIQFIEDHETFFRRKNLGWIFSIREFYLNHIVLQHQKSRDNYFVSFENLLTYTYDNFENIMEHQSQQHMKNYDAYYFRYRLAADTHNRFNRKRIGYQKQFIADHPEVSPFLPGSHHLEPFKFWDKFSF